MSDKVIIRLRYGDEQSLRTRSEAVMRALVQPDKSYDLSISLISTGRTLFQGQFPQDEAKIWHISQPHAQSDLQVSLNIGLTYWRFLQSPDEVNVASIHAMFRGFYGTIVHDRKPLEFGPWFDNLRHREIIRGWTAELPRVEETPLVITLRYQSLNEMIIQLDSVSAYQAFLGDGDEQWWRSRNPEIQANLNTLWKGLEQLVSATQPLAFHVFTSGAELEPLEAHVAYYATETELLAAVSQVEGLWHQGDTSSKVRRDVRGTWSEATGHLSHREDPSPVPLQLPPTPPQERYYQVPEYKPRQMRDGGSPPSPWRWETQAKNSETLHRAWLRWHKLHEALPLLAQRSWQERQQVLNQTCFEAKQDAQGGWWVRSSRYFMNETLEDFYLELMTGQADFQPVGVSAEFQGPPRFWQCGSYRLFVVGVDDPETLHGAYNQWMLWSQQTGVSWPLREKYWHSPALAQIIRIVGWQVVRDYQAIFELLLPTLNYKVIGDKRNMDGVMSMEMEEFETMAIYQWLHPPEVDEAKQQVRFWVQDNSSADLLEVHLTQHGRLVEFEIWVRGILILLSLRSPW